MANWTFERVKHLQQQLSGAGDPNDPRERKRRQIINAATTLFIGQGYRKTSIAEVAELAGVAKGTIYLYAKSKSDLMIQAIVEEKRRYFEALRPIMDPRRAPRDRLRRWLKAALVLSHEMPLVSRLMSGDREILVLLEEMDPGVRDQVMGLQQEFVAELLEEAARPHRWADGELQDRARVLMGLLYSSGVFADRRLRGGLSLERFAELLSEMIVEGVGSAAAETKENP